MWAGSRAGAKAGAGRRARTAGESLDLLGQVASHAAAWSTKGDRSDSLSGRARTTGTRLRLTEGSITQVRPHLSGVEGFDAVESFAFSLVSMSASSARRRGSASKHSCCEHDGFLESRYVKGCRGVNHQQKSQWACHAVENHTWRWPEWHASRRRGGGIRRTRLLGRKSGSEAAHPSIR